MAKRSRAHAARRCFPYLALLLVAATLPRSAAAEKVLAKVDDWEFFSDGRAGGFASYVYGDGLPADTYVTDFNGNPAVLRTVQGGGFASSHEQGPLDVPGVTFPTDQPRPPNAGHINMWRIRSGFVSNILGFGTRAKLTPYTTFSTYVQLWMFVESEGRQKNRPNYPDARQGYAKLEGPWGSFLMGRTRALFSRGATDIDSLYAHRWGVGWPGSIDSNGPSLGQIGFGVLGSGFASGVIYGTPSIGGLQLNVGAFDPIQLQGSGGWNRTVLARPEAELTFELKFGATGKLVLFANGAIQKVYKEGYCRTTLLSTEAPGTVLPPCSATAGGFGYGGRFELGHVHIGVAGHYGQGLGLNYALEVSPAAQDNAGNMRKFDGYYGQLQLVFGRVDLFAGAGIARVFLTDFDKTPNKPDPTDPLSASADPTMARQVFGFSVIKYQFGANAGIVFHVTPNVHFDLDAFRAEAGWYFGEKQVVWVGNGGMMVSW
jgi:hypothetical protein